MSFQHGVADKGVPAAVPCDTWGRWAVQPVNLSRPNGGGGDG